jgi:hypothetical protein
MCTEIKINAHIGVEIKSNAHIGVEIKINVTKGLCTLITHRDYFL